MKINTAPTREVMNLADLHGDVIIRLPHDANSQEFYNRTTSFHNMNSKRFNTKFKIEQFDTIEPDRSTIAHWLKIETK